MNRFLRFSVMMLIAAALFAAPMSTVRASDTAADAKIDIDITKISVDYEKIKAAYAYDKSAPLNLEITGTREFSGYTEYTFSYDSPSGERVPALIMMPKPHVKPMKKDRASAEGLYPAVFLMHFHVSDKSLSQLFATWPGYGVAVMAIDGVFRGGREDSKMDIIDPDPKKFASYMKIQITDMLRGFDVLRGWKGVDPERIGFMGISMGALTGTAAVALDPSIKSIILADGAADFATMFNNSDYGSLVELKKHMVENNIPAAALVDAFSMVEPAIFAERIGDRPVMLLNGKQDTTMSVPAMEKLHSLITTEKKKVKWYDSGHILPFDKVLYDSLSWFKSTL